MSVEVVPGGHRRIDRVLDPRFTDGVERLDLAELRARREEAEAELFAWARTQGLPIPGP